MTIIRTESNIEVIIEERPFDVLAEINQIEKENREYLFAKSKAAYKKEYKRRKALRNPIRRLCHGLGLVTL